MKINDVEGVWQVTLFLKDEKPYYLKTYGEEIEEILYGKDYPSYEFKTREAAEDFLNTAKENGQGGFLAKVFHY